MDVRKQPVGPEPSTPEWRRPDQVLRGRKIKNKKRALFESMDSPTKRTKQNTQSSSSGPISLDDSGDDPLMDLGQLSGPETQRLSFKSVGELIKTTPKKQSVEESPFQFSPVRQSQSSQEPSTPVRSYLPSLSLSETPISLRKRRELLPARVPISPALPLPKRTFKRTRKLIKEERHSSSDLSSDNWYDELGLDWSLKTSMRLSSPTPFGWSITNLKAFEESCGITSFVRCVDPRPTSGPQSQLSPSGDGLGTTLGSQFHQCCMYWQHPSLPTLSLFPRDSSINPGFSGSQPLSSTPQPLKFEEKVYDVMFEDWIDSFRSVFQLLRAKQCPFFYVNLSQFTALFCSVGTQGSEEIQVFITPATRGFREALKSEGIKFTVPYYAQSQEGKEECEGSAHNSQTISPSILDPEELEPDEKMDGGSDEDQWLDDLGISQNLSLTSSTRMFDGQGAIDEKNRTNLVMITGDDTLRFFNFMINNRNFVISTTGIYAGVPPTLLSPVAFHGAALKSLKVKQSKLKIEDGTQLHHIEMTGPILPHVPHLISSLLNKTLENYKMHFNTLNSTIPLNIYENSKPSKTTGIPNIFQLQSLCDCGLRTSLLQVFLRSDNCHTITDQLECKGSKYRWS